MSPKVLITNWVHPEVVEFLEGDCDVVANRNREAPLTRDQILEKGQDALGMIAFMPDTVDDALLAGLPNLRIVACALKGYDNFDVEACTRRGVWLTIVPDLLTVPTAELTIGLMIGLARKIRQGDRHIRSGRFQGWRPMLYGTGLAGSTVGIVGMGAVGQAVAQRLAGFDADLLYHDPRPLPAERESRLGLRSASFDQLLGASDYVVLALPLSEHSIDIIDLRALERMKRGSLLINPARGSLVDEEAVADALASGQLAGYAADVFEMEDWARPDRRHSVSQRLIADRERTLLTPHLGSAVDATRKLIAMEAAHNVLQVAKGMRPQGAINEPVGPPRHAAS